ncbi:hypothetical protein HfxHF1_345 [Halophage HF1]|uniref:Uncharacterized protein n=2 Tax=Haloferacalesvirus TaxID=2843389 RepID=Q8V6Q4_9CAUD|nr:hypothetical protein HrrHF2_345 [Halorubrum phage HF2]NP_861637.1 hypothetical protein HfxHF1_345 [Halophage HF1]AAL54971.1 hypothetical protein HrrHF2_345 [Halorubrum phage HF2]AAO61348.1 hypothetical protein HfxHF1_345 [Halophage HF1]QIR31102.1 hypothetical protein HrrHc2_315 [Halorubrum virus Hardycor2]
MSELQELKRQVEQKLERIENDDRVPDSEDYADEAASVHVNAPLAMIQATEDSKRSTLEWVSEKLEAAGV